jgi:hypothetical protein
MYICTPCGGRNPDVEVMIDTSIEGMEHWNFERADRHRNVLVTSAGGVHGIIGEYASALAFDVTHQSQITRLPPGLGALPFFTCGRCSAVAFRQTCLEDCELR